MAQEQTTTTTETLLPCPFCGTVPQMNSVTIEEEMNEGRYDFFVECVGKCPMGLISTGGPWRSPDAAAKVWNTRAPAPQPPLDAGEQVRLLLPERVAHAARQFCEEVQEDADGVPQLQLENLNRALDAWEALPELPDGPYDDSQPALAALQSLAADPHATDNQRRAAHLAHQIITNHEAETDKEIRRLQDGIRDHLISLGAPDCLIDGAGCDSGDPLDFTKAEITQAFNYFKETDNEPRT